MADYYDPQLSPAPDSHGHSPYPINSTNDVNPYGDQHGSDPYPQNSSGDVHPAADDHCNDNFFIPGPMTPKPGSFKEQSHVSPKQPPVL